MQVTDGDARVLVTAVGPNSEWGAIMDKVQTEEDTETPLQEKLGVRLICCIAAAQRHCQTG